MDFIDYVTFTKNETHLGTGAKGGRMVTLGRPLVGDEVLQLKEPSGRIIHSFQSPEAQGVTSELDDEYPETTGKFILLNTQTTNFVVTDFSGADLLVTTSNRATT